MRDDQLNEMFGGYRKPTEVTIPKYQAIQEKTMELAKLINELCPDEGHEKLTAFYHLQTAKMFANAAIAIWTK